VRDEVRGEYRVCRVFDSIESEAQRARNVGEGKGGCMGLALL
jgi:hypothetical protein